MGWFYVATYVASYTSIGTIFDLIHKMYFYTFTSKCKECLDFNWRTL